MAKRIRVVCGDITRADCDAVVNAWNRNFIPYWLLLPQGVAGALRRAAGREPFREVSRRGLLDLGEAVVTSGGSLGADAIIHVAALHATWRSSARAVQLGAENAFRAAAQIGAKRLAIPLLGAGTGGVPPRTSLTLLLDAWRSADTRPDDTEIYVFDVELYEALVVGDAWDDGYRALSEGRFWDAHEHWEEIWRLLPSSSGRDTVQALIQWVAACHKVVQAIEGADVERMQRGMSELVRSGRGRLGDARGASGAPGTRLNLQTIDDAYREVERLLSEWRSGLRAPSVLEELQEEGADLARRLQSECDGRPIRAT